MKLRIRGNSLRLRLLRGEIETLKEKLFISEEINFGATKLLYSIEILQNPTDKNIRAFYFNSEITVYIPDFLAQEWIETNQISLSAEQTDGDNVLQILIEKDFVCVGRDDADNADAFENPAVNL